MRPIRLDPLGGNQLRELDTAYRTDADGKVRIRALMVPLAAERGMVAAEVAGIARHDEETVRRWFARYRAEGVNGLSEAPRAGAPPKATDEYRRLLLGTVRRRPRVPGLRMSVPSVHRPLRAGGMAMSRPQHMISSPDPDRELKKSRSSGPPMARARARPSAMPTSSTSAGCRRSGRSGAPRAGG